MGAAGVIPVTPSGALTRSLGFRRFRLPSPILTRVAGPTTPNPAAGALGAERQAEMTGAHRRRRNGARRKLGWVFALLGNAAIPSAIEGRVYNLDVEDRAGWRLGEGEIAAYAKPQDRDCNGFQSSGHGSLRSDVNHLDHLGTCLQPPLWG